MEPIFSIPVVFQDGCAADVLADIVAAVDRLDTVTDMIFDTVERRVQAQQEHIARLLSRVEDCKFKIDQVAQQSSNAVTVFAPSKHPFTERQPNRIYQSLLADLRKQELPEEMEEHTDCGLRRYEPSEVTESTYPSSSAAVAEIAEAILGCNVKPVERGKEEVGLGGLPENLSAVSSSVVFNTKLNPYEAYEIVDNLVSTDNEVANEKRRKEQQELEEKKLLSEAPVSIREGDTVPELADYEIGFRPQLKEMEALTLPSNLSLPDIANLNFDQDIAHKSIAPSLHNTESDSAALPQIMDAVPAPTPPPTASKSHEENSVPPKVAPQLPPPPPPKSAPPSTIAAVKAPQQVAPLPVPSKSFAPATEGDGRTGLLAAIRDKSNMARLKKVSEDTRLRTKESPKSNEAEQLSFAEEMKMKLKRRQKALRGQSAEEEEEEERRRQRRRELRAPLNAVHAIGKMKAQAGLFDLQNVSGIDDLLSARAAAAPNKGSRSHSPSLFSDDSGDWDED